MKWLDLVDSINIIARLEMLVGAVLHSRPRGLRGKPAPGAKTGTHQMTLDRTNPQRISGTAAVTYLQRRGVKCWAGRTTSQNFIWYVNAAQASYAQYLIKDLLATKSHPAWKDRK